MKVTFTIDYYTRWGEYVAICGSIPQLGNGKPSSAAVMNIDGSSFWQLTVEIDDHIDEFEYRYLILSPEGTVLRSESADSTRHFVKTGDISNARMVDSWRSDPVNSPFLSSAFTQCFFRRNDHRIAPKAHRGAIRLFCLNPRIDRRFHLAISGSLPELGEWDPCKALRCDDADFPVWNTLIQCPGEGNTGFEFKFLLIDNITGKLIQWETGPNRLVKPGLASAHDFAAIDCGTPLFEIPLWYGAGTAIPVFSIRTEDDFGVGDFHSILRMIDWCVATGQRVLQLLPVNDTTMTDTWRDSYPYNANSTFALHPIYLHLQSVGSLSEPARTEHYRKIAAELNALPVVDYERVTQAKEMYSRELYAQVADTLESDTQFKDFVAHNASWLVPYAAYRLLCRRYRTSDMSQWGEYAVYDPVKIARLSSSHSKEIRYHYFVQYHLDRQMRQARDYAALNGVALKGDIPIGISRTSVDAWICPRLFNLGCQAGAPPDAFSVLGQNWGFPTYNWDEMSRDHYGWWKDRFRKMAEFFHAYRIDHVLGFFRIWEIPVNAIHGLLGYFNPALPLSPDEITSKFGLDFDELTYVRPYISDDMLTELFGSYADDVRRDFLNPICGTARYTIRPDYDSQRKVAVYFAGLSHNERNHRICEGLLTAIDDVLFIEDPYQPGKYHPRISAQSTFVYNSLSAAQRDRFDALYQDYFYCRHNDFWAGKAMQKLPPLIQSTDMLVCAEDLGMIPACVPSVLDELHVLSLEIQRMPKAFGESFGNPETYPYLSVCSTSTHDMSGIRKWWEEDPGITQLFYHDVLHYSGQAPQVAYPWICDRIVDMNLSSSSMLCILPLQDWLSVNASVRRDDAAAERINEPSNPMQYWQYRMHISVDKLLKQSDFIAFLRDKIRRSGR